MAVANFGGQSRIAIFACTHHAKQLTERRFGFRLRECMMFMKRCAGL